MKNIRIFLVACVFPLWGIGGLNAQVTIIDGGVCGADPPFGQNLIWYLYSDSVLRISGSGDMYDYTSFIPESQRPWDMYSDKIHTVIIGDSVTSIGFKAFAPSMAISGYGHRFTSVIIGNSVTSIGGNAFYWCIGLTSVIIGNNVTSIGGGGFANCSKLTSITIPNSVTAIGNAAFNSCSSLTSVRIGNSVASIGERSFGDCINLSAITISATNPPILNGNEVFDNVPDTIPIYVPCASVSAYQDSAGWNSFNNYIGMGFTDTTFLFDTICYSIVYNNNDFNIPAVEGIYYRTIPSVHKCDSVIELNLTVYPKQDTVIFNDTIYYGTDYTQNGFTIANVTKDSIYFNNSQNINNCDSVTQLNLMVSGVGITNYELRITNYELRITNYELRITNYELRITNYEKF